MACALSAATSATKATTVVSAEYPEPSIQSGETESDMGNGYHNDQNPRGLAVRVRSHRPVFACRCWLVHAIEGARRSDAEGIVDGCVATQTRARAAGAF